MRFGFVLLYSIIVIIALTTAAYADPTLATVTAGTPEHWTGPATGTSVTAQGGNITPVNISGQTQTESWQGFYGEVTGNITLRDNSGDQMYSWALIALAGDVFASRSNAVVWATIAGQTTCTADEALTGTGSDRTNRTFTRNNATTGWTVAGTAITDACQTFTYINNASQNLTFEEIILTDTTNLAYATKIYPNTVGFDGATHDYQLIVPTNATTATSTYYIYVEFT